MEARWGRNGLSWDENGVTPCTEHDGVYSSQGELSGGSSGARTVLELGPGCVSRSSQGSHRGRRFAEWERRGNMHQHQRNRVCQGP